MFLDTSGLLNLLYQTEQFHQTAVSLYSVATHSVTHNLVLAEFVALAQVRRLDRQRCLRFAQDLSVNPGIALVWVDPALHAKGMAILLSRRDKDYTLCDAISFVVMRERNVRDALSTDRHFEQEGFRRHLV
jgi:predicted nucleic acid-binding protein